MSKIKPINQKKQKKFHMSRFILVFVILSIFTFTGLAMYVQIKSGVELSPTLIGCFFGFCTGELWMLASIKKKKIVTHFEDDPSTPQNEAEIYSDIYNQGYEDAMAQLRNKFFNDNGGNGQG